MYQEFIIPFPPISINKMFLRNRSYSKAARLYRFEVLKLLQEPENLFKTSLLHEAFDPQNHSFSVELITYYPLEQFYTQKGTVSAKTLDLSNVEKLTIDCFFMEKYCTPKFLESRKGFERGLYLPFKTIQNVKHDDRFVTNLKSLKRANKEASEPFQLVRIDIIPLNSL